MMRYVTFIIVVVGVASVTNSKECRTSNECSPGLCCRYVDNTPEARTTSLFGHRTGESKGTCIAVQGKKGETCTRGCLCGDGLACYRPPAGICCLDGTCQPEDYVKERNEYWRNCFRNLKCTLPMIPYIQP